MHAAVHTSFQGANGERRSGLNSFHIGLSNLSLLLGGTHRLIPDIPASGDSGEGAHIERSE